jgi:regulator of replication initiation timing
MEPAVYLLHVLTTWTTFCERHPNIKEAIIGILCENQALKIENEKLKERLKDET